LLRKLGALELDPLVVPAIECCGSMPTAS